MRPNERRSCVWSGRLVILPGVIRLVLFDIDGTLIHTGGAGVKAFARTFATEFGISNGTERMKFAGRTDTSLVREFFMLHDIEESAENFQRFFDRYVFWLDHILDHSNRGGALPGVHEFIRGLNELASRPAVGLLTGNIRLGAEIKLRRYQLWEHFETGAFGDDHEDRNQIASIARERGGELLQEGLRGEQVLVIGDTPRDIECARAIGARTLAVATGGAQFDELKAHRPEWLARDLSEVSADEICG